MISRAPVNTIFEESTNGLRFAKHQDVKIDASVALAMAALAALRSNQHIDPAWKYRAFSENWVDPDAPAQPPDTERDPGKVFASGDWWRGMPGPTLTISSAVSIATWPSASNGEGANATE